MSSSHERIGRYEVLRKIATGGMAELFLAKQVGMEGFEKVVAIKRILAHLAYDEEFINMFRDEARIVAKLSHPNIVQIYDLGKSDETYFIAMEYIPGRNLSSIAKRAKLKEEPLPPEYIARCVAQAAEGLYYAHTRKDIDGRPLKIVHRDVSPQNIIVSFSGTVKLVDFGIAKAATKIAHTRAGVLKGKYAYMSPEQIRGEEIDARSDLFAMGIVLYELMAGRRPFEKENSIQTLKAIVQEPHKDIRELNPAVPDVLSKIIDKALTKDSNKRYQDAQEIQIALEDFVSASATRCNNITISNWVQSLFAEELSRERGGTIVFQGVGEVILPEVEPDPAQPQQSNEVPVELDEFDDDSQPLPLQRGRGGGSVDSRPPIPAPSNSLIESLSEYEQSNSSSPSGRRGMLEEQELSAPRPVSSSGGGFDDDATVHMLDHLPSNTSDVLEEGEIDRPLQPMVFDDGKTEFSPPLEDSMPKGGEMDDDTSEHGVVELDGKRSALPGTPRSDLWEEATIGLRDDELPAALQEAQDAEETVGPEAELDEAEDSPTISPDRPLMIPPAATIPAVSLVDADSDPEAPNAWGDLSGSYEKGPISGRDEDLWDDKTAQNNDAYLADAIPSPTVEDMSFEDPSGIRASEVKGDPTILGPALDDEESGEVSADFEGDRTIAATPGLMFPEEEDSGGWSSDATIAAADPLIPDEEEVPMVDETGLDQEGVLPEGIDITRDVDQDGATLAGVTSDFINAGLKPPIHAFPTSTRQKEKARESAREKMREKSTAREDSFAERPRTRQERLGAIKLSKVAAAPDSGVFDSGFATAEEITQGEIDAKPPVPMDDVSAMDFEFEDSAYDEGELPSRVKSSASSQKALYDSAQEEYSALVVPKSLTPLNPRQGAMHIGSTNVPPAALSLSDMLHEPRPNIGRQDDGSIGRSATMLGRQIREVVRSPSELPQPVVVSQPPQAPVAREREREREREPQQAPLQDLQDPDLMNAPPLYEAPPVPSRRGGSRVLMAALIAVGVACLATMAYYLIPLLAPSNQHLTIRTTPTGATVFVDEKQQEGTTPLTIKGLEPGISYQIRLQREGFEPIAREVRLPPNRPLIWQIPLKPRPTVSPAN